MIKTKIFNIFFHNFLTSSLRQVDQDDKSSALLQRKKIPTYRRENTVISWIGVNLFLTFMKYQFNMPNICQWKY